MNRHAMTPPFRAQFGEDRLLAERFAGKRDGVFVEIGAYDGEELSNSWHFEQLGWTGVLVEANPDLAAQCQAARPRSHVFGCAVVGPDRPAEVSFEITDEANALSSLGLDDEAKGRVVAYAGRLQMRRVTVPARTLDSILEEAGVGSIDFLTVDVEGYEHEVLRGFDLDRWRPEVLILERNSALPERRIVRRLHRAGYAYLRTTGVNDWFVPSRRGLAYSARLARAVYLPGAARLLREWPAPRRAWAAVRRAPRAAARRLGLGALRRWWRQAA